MSKAVTSDQPSVDEERRIERVMSLLPKDAVSVLEIGARHGVMTRRLAAVFKKVTALDLQMPSFDIAGVEKVEGDVQRLRFPDNQFDCVVCTEVLEHVPDVAAAAREITRVTRAHIVVGVPYRQDRRVGRLTCLHCGRINPPYGHLNSFDEKRLFGLFDGAEASSVEYVSENRERTNAVSVWLQDLAGNPYGTYDQEESCINCGHRLQRPNGTSFVRRAAGALGLALYNMQYARNRPQPTWMLVHFQKRNG